MVPGDAARDQLALGASLNTSPSRWKRVCTGIDGAPLENSPSSPSPPGPHRRAMRSESHRAISIRQCGTAAPSSKRRATSSQDGTNHAFDGRWEWRAAPANIGPLADATKFWRLQGMLHRLGLAGWAPRRPRKNLTDSRREPSSGACRVLVAAARFGIARRLGHFGVPPPPNGCPIAHFAEMGRTATLRGAVIHARACGSGYCPPSCRTLIISPMRGHSEAGQGTSQLRAPRHAH